MRIGEGGEEDVRDLEKELEERRLAEEALEEGASQAATQDFNNNNNTNNNNNIGKVITSPMTSPMTSPVNTARKSNQLSTHSSPAFPTDSFNDNNNNHNNNNNRINNNSNLSFSPPLGRQSIVSNLSVSPLSAPQMSPASVNQSPRASAELQRRMSGSSHGSLYGEIDHGAGSAPFLDEPMDSLDEDTINAIDQIEQQALLQSPPVSVSNNTIKGVVIKEEDFDEEMVQEVTTTRTEIKAEDPEDVDQIPTQPMKGTSYNYFFLSL
jgi:hypothetical protein